MSMRGQDHTTDFPGLRSAAGSVGAPPCVGEGERATSSTRSPEYQRGDKASAPEGSGGGARERNGPPPQLPPRVAQAVVVIRHYHQKHGRMPTLDRLKLEMNTKSNSHIRKILDRLSAHGVLKRNPPYSLREGWK